MEFTKVSLTMLFICSVYIQRCRCQTAYDATRLISNLTTNYDTRVKPVINQTDTVNIDFLFIFISLHDFDDLTGMVTFQAMTYFSWTEERMTWNPADYGNLTFVTLRDSDVWKPTLIMINAPDHRHLPGMNAKDVIITYDGMVYLSSMDWLQTSCNVDVEKYPFDSQRCLISICPWLQHHTAVTLNPTGHSGAGALQYQFVENSAWKVEMDPVQSEIINGVSTMHTMLTCTRRATYTVLNLIIPILSLAFLNLWVFLLPPESGERVSFSITVLLSFVLYMGILDDNIPKGSEPLAHLTELLSATLFYSVSLLFWMIVSLRIYNNSDTQRIPKFLQQTVRCLLFKKFRTVKQSKEAEKGVVDDAIAGDKMEAFDEGLKTKQAWVASSVNALEPGKVTWRMVGKTFDIYVVLLHMVWWTVLMVQVYQLSVPNE